MIEAVVFDLDGVIVDSEPVWEQVRRQVVAEYGGTWAPDAQRRIMGMSTGEWARYLSTDLGVGLRGLEGIWTNREVTGMKAVPRRMIVLGGGAVGVEMAQAVRRLGGEVVLVEDTSGKGHISKFVGGAMRRSIFVALD